MKEIFEQFLFIPKMFNTSEVKVQACALWSAVWMFLLSMIDKAMNFTVDVIGVSVFYSILLFIVMVADFVTGIRASKKEWMKDHPGEKWKSESKKGLRWVIKYITYIAGFFVIKVMTGEVSTLNMGIVTDLSGIDFDAIFVLLFKIIKLFLMLYVLRWELKSIDENLERLGHDFQIFDFFDNVVTAVTGILKTKTGIDINDTKKDNDEKQ